MCRERPTYCVMAALRSEQFGRSIKNISEKRPFLNSSKGSSETSFAVATRNTLLLDSCNQNKNCPKTRLPMSFPESETERDFSISSIQTTQAGYYSWIMNGDFPLNTKKILTEIKLRGFNSK